MCFLIFNFNLEISLLFAFLFLSSARASRDSFYSLCQLFQLATRTYSYIYLQLYELVYSTICRYVPWAPCNILLSSIIYKWVCHFLYARALEDADWAAPISFLFPFFFVIFCLFTCVRQVGAKVVKNAAPFPLQYFKKSRIFSLFTIGTTTNS